MKHVDVISDVTVVGGGLAGVAAAVAAARLGARVALINNRPVLGGNASSEVRVWVCGATSHGAQKFARETGVMGELFLENQYRNPEGNPILWDQVVHDIVRAEPNIHLFLNTDARVVDADGPEHARMIRTVAGYQQGTESAYRFTSPLFIDCTGDGLVGHLAGAEYRQGREARRDFEERWAPEAPDDNMLGSTLLFYVKDTGTLVRFVAPSIAKDITTTSILSQRRVSTTDNGCDYWWIEWGGELDTVADNESIRDELWAVVYGIWDHIKNSGEYDAETLTLEWVGTIPGKREYRRFTGDYTLVQQDIMAQTHFEDAVAFGGWSIDLHPPGGMYADEAGSKHLFTSGVYHVPWRSLYSANVSNMLMAGRDISASHVAFGTTRVMGTCAATGEAAGTGAALALRLGVSPRELGEDHLPVLRRTLLDQDAPILGARWDDSRDIALTARVSASSVLRHLRTDSQVSELSPFSLADHDLGLLVPSDPHVTAIEVSVAADEACDVDVSWWTTERGENHIPVRRLESQRLSVGQGSSVLRFDVSDPDPDFDSAIGNRVLVLGRDPRLSVFVQSAPGPYGTLALLSRTPRSTAPENEQYPQTNAWSAMELRRHSIAFAIEPETSAYRPEQVIGGHARPFNGPQLWSSASLHDGEPEWIELEWDVPTRLERIDLLFNDDVDEDIVNLHHHATPFPVIPELVRQYRLEVRTTEGWQLIAGETENRWRHRRHAVDVSAETLGLRLTIEATHGSRHAMVHAIRAFSIYH